MQWMRFEISQLQLRQSGIEAMRTLRVQYDPRQKQGRPALEMSERAHQ